LLIRAQLLNNTQTNLIDAHLRVDANVNFQNQ
jgi:hypothetical protein